MITILHIIDSLSGAGPARSLLSIAKYAAEQKLAQQHRVVTLQSRSYPVTLLNAAKAGITVLRKPDRETLTAELKQADIVQVHFWNNPDMYEFLRSDLPETRLLIWFKILGDHPPQMITPELAGFPDFALGTSPYTLELPVFQMQDGTQRNQKKYFIYGIADWDRLKNLKPRSHNYFNVGYIGTVNFSKMHPDFIPLSIGISIPDSRFIVCGGINETLQKQAAEQGVSEKFDFRGYVEKIEPVLEILDVFGYPLCEDTYATSEKSLQEAMYAGVPPVVFPHGGCPDLVEHEQTGMVAGSKVEYQQAIEYLYHHPEFRRKLGQNAADYARIVFDSRSAVIQMHNVYEKMMKHPKRKRRWYNTMEKQELSPSRHFVQSLGTAAQHFNISLNSDDPDRLLDADRVIMNSSALLAEGEGGIFQYRNYYQNDPYLRLWTGLILQKKQRHKTALAEFDAAIHLGFSHWRVYWYQAGSFIETGDLTEARKALTLVMATAPAFSEAKDLFSALPKP
ncbi:MAG: glycosyltransferase [Balneolaceae bacterium]|nr:MAG: glycosyltransferase [Balneolaceae bacterium]